MFRKIRNQLVLISLILPLLLSGCGSVVVRTDVRYDGSFDARVDILLERQVLSLATVATRLPDPFIPLRKSLLKEGFAVTKLQQGNRVGVRAVRHYNRVSDFRLAGEQLLGRVSVTRGLLLDQYHAEASIDVRQVLSPLTASYSSTLTPQLINTLYHEIEFRYILSLPVAIGKSNADHVIDNGRTAQWDVDPSQMTNLNIMAECTAPNPIHILLFGGVLLLVLGLGIMIVRRRARVSAWRQGYSHHRE